MALGLLRYGTVSVGYGERRILRIANKDSSTHSSRLDCLVICFKTSQILRGPRTAGIQCILQKCVGQTHAVSVASVFFFQKIPCNPFPRLQRWATYNRYQEYSGNFLKQNVKPCVDHGFGCTVCKCSRVTRKLCGRPRNTYRYGVPVGMRTLRGGVRVQRAGDKRSVGK